MSNNNSFDGTGLNTSNTNSVADMPTSSTSETEDLMWTLLARAGLISKFKGEIAKCLQENCGTVLSESAKIQARADPAILQSIYEYLQWIGMKQTSAFLLSESSVSFDVSTTFENKEPNLCQLFRKPESPDLSADFEEQLKTPSSFVNKKEDTTISINVGNRTYTTGPAPTQSDENLEVPDLSKSRPNASANFTKGSLYFTPGGSPASMYLTTRENETGEVDMADVRNRNDTREVLYITKIPDENENEPQNPQIGGARKNAEDKSNMSLKSMPSEAVDSSPSPPPPPYKERAETRRKASNTESEESLSRLKESNDESAAYSASRSPTFLSPSSSSSSEQIIKSRPSEAPASQQNNAKETSQPQPAAADGKEEDNTFEENESISDFLGSLPDNNTQDLSLAGGAASESESKELESCDHVVRL